MGSCRSKNMYMWCWCPWLLSGAPRHIAISSFGPLAYNVSIYYRREDPMPISKSYYLYSDAPFTGRSYQRGMAPLTLMRSMSRPRLRVLEVHVSITIFFLFLSCKDLKFGVLYTPRKYLWCINMSNNGFQICRVVKTR